MTSDHPTTSPVSPAMTNESDSGYSVNSRGASPKEEVSRGLSRNEDIEPQDSDLAPTAGGEQHTRGHQEQVDPADQPDIERAHRLAVPL